MKRSSEPVGRSATAGRSRFPGAAVWYNCGMVREPAVAGAFYAGEAGSLARDVDGFLAAGAGGSVIERAIACVVPHAGYVYSGGVAGAVYSSLEIPSRIILIGPRHFPQGAAMAILSEGAFRTPLGEGRIDAELAAALRHECPLLREDALAHAREHSLEVQLPFLQRLRPEFSFVPVVLASDRFQVLEELGRSIARAVAAAGGPVLIVASTDMNHYESDAVTRAKDALAIARIDALDARGLYDTVRNEGITMCGYAATVATIVAARELGASDAQLVKYATSGEVNGDYSRVVGYAGFVVR
jgi:AmmeMemoRadiSam system protein B